MSVTGKILVIDDNQYSTDMLREMLEGEGYDVDLAENETAARSAVVSVQPDLILLDTRLSGTDVFALHKSLTADGPLRDIPVIFMSADDDAEMKIKGFEVGDDHLTKPFEPREVLTRVERQVTVSRVRQALRESEAKFQSVMESAIDAIISADVSGCIRSWNRAASVLFGYSAEEVIGEPLELIIPKQHRSSHREGINRVSSGGPSHVIGKTVELSAIRRDGTEFPIELSLATWFLDEDRYYTGIIRDISERKEAEQKFRSVTESAIDAIISADHSGVIISWNSAATRILGYTPEEAIGQPLEIIIPERHHEAHRTGMNRVTEGGPSRVIGSTVELHARTREGREIPIELSLSTWMVHENRYYTGIIRDISERKQAEDRLRTYAEELARQHEDLKLAQSSLIDAEKQAMLGRLLAGLLHEVNTPLGVLRSSVSSIGKILNNFRRFVEQGDGPDEEVKRELLKRIDIGDHLAATANTSTHRITELVAGLKHFVSTEGAESKVYDLRGGLDSVLKLLDSRLNERIRIERCYPDEPAEVFGDEARINQAFLNVVENAFDALDDAGTIAVRIERMGEFHQVTVTDTGCGMSEDQIKSAFDFAFTSRDGRVRLRLGLATSRRTIEEAGGRLEIKSKKGEGTTVYIALPVAKAASKSSGA